MPDEVAEKLVIGELKDVEKRVKRTERVSDLTKEILLIAKEESEIVLEKRKDGLRKVEQKEEGNAPILEQEVTVDLEIDTD